MIIKRSISTVCTCRGEAHDDCRPCVECGEAPALNDVNGADGPVWLCHECYEEEVEAEEEAHRNEA